MAITRSWESSIALTREAVKPPVPPERKRELAWLIAASLVVGVLLALVYRAKARDFADANQLLSTGTLLNINRVSKSADVEPFVDTLATEEDRRQAAEWIAAHSGHLPNAGALARGPVRRNVARIKPLIVVRTPGEYTRAFALWIAAYFAAFYVVHFAWRWRRFRGDPLLLPALHVVTGAGLAMAVSIRDPLRDTLEFQRFAWGCVAGCLLLLVPLIRGFNIQLHARQVYTPLAIAFVLFAALAARGSGPSGSDSKVNLGPLQPVEAIKVLLVFFMAGYFARRWEWLREVHSTVRGIRLPRLSIALPVMVAVTASLAMFFVLKDLGPALVTGFLFLTLFAVARGRPGLAVAGIALLVGGVWAGYHIRTPRTVVDRISMWLSPWDNDVRGGDQIAHATWALASGGTFGSGAGQGDPVMIPAGHTDLIVPAIGEEFGFAGVALAGLLFVLLFQRAMRAARFAANEYGFFVTFGFGALIAVEMLLISAGVLGVLPLSGVVSPFLSSGNSAMLANFLIAAVIASVSAHPGTGEAAKPFLAGKRWFAGLLAVLTIVLVAKAGSIQVLHDQEWIVRDTHVFQEDGVKRAQHNPRLNSLERELVRGDIVDRNGIAIATSDYRKLADNRALYQQLGVSVDDCCSKRDSRHYPFGSATAHLTGDLRTGENFHATNSSLIEHDENERLRGFERLADLAPLVRYRHQPGHTGLAALRARDRTVHSTIDIRLQLKAAQVLKRRLRASRHERGALVVLSAHSGEVLALASAPEIPATGTRTPDELLDRARYGLYPPGSTFKLVTAMAALRVDPELAKKRFRCAPLGGGRVGARIAGWNRPIRDDVGDAAHGNPDMEHALTVSCNAYFAQLGAREVGAQALIETAKLLDIPVGDAKELRQMLPFAAFGQGPVLISPLKMARVTAAVADGGIAPAASWVAGVETRATPILAAESAAFLARAMRSVVENGTGRTAMAGLDLAVAGKTGTAQVAEGAPHSWFTAFAPYDAPPAERIALAVVVEHGGYGAAAAAPIARELIEAARDLGIIHGNR